MKLVTVDHMQHSVRTTFSQQAAFPLKIISILWKPAEIKWCWICTFGVSLHRQKSTEFYFTSAKFTWLMHIDRLATFTLSCSKADKYIYFEHLNMWNKDVNHTHHHHHHHHHHHSSTAQFGPCPPLFEFRNNNFFTGLDCYSSAQPPTWRTRSPYL
jgi:hypothetical protein